MTNNILSAMQKCMLLNSMVRNSPRIMVLLGRSTNMKDFIITVAGLLAIIWLALQIFSSVVSLQAMGVLAGMM